MKNELNWLEREAYDEWNDFVQACENSTVFHLSHLLEPLAGFFGCTFRILVKRDNENRIVAGFPLLEKKKFGALKLTYYPPMIPFYGIIHNNRQSDYGNKRTRYLHKMHGEFIDFLEKYFDYAKLTFPISVRDIRPFIWKGFSTSVYYTFSSAIESPEKCYDRFDPDVRRRIKSAEKESSDFVSGVNSEQINSIFMLQEQSLDRQGLHFKLNKDQFSGYIEMLNKHQLVNIYTIRLKEIPVTSILALQFRDTAYYWMAGTDSSIASTGFNQLNLWMMIKDLHARGIRFFDFVGASTPHIAEYKNTFNFELRSYYMAEKSFNQLTASLMQMKRVIGKSRPR